MIHSSTAIAWIPRDQVTSVYQYEREFFDYINQGSLDSASVVAPLLVSALRPRSVLDVGCGQGAWLRVWGESGVPEFTGVDGP